MLFIEVFPWSRLLLFCEAVMIHELYLHCYYFAVTSFSSSFFCVMLAGSSCYSI